MQKTKKRAVSVLLSVLLLTALLTAIPMTVFAAGTEYYIGGTDPGGVDWYVDLDALMLDISGSFTDGDSVTLLGDISFSDCLYVDVDVTIDLNSFDLTIDGVSSVDYALDLDTSSELQVYGPGTFNINGAGADDGAVRVGSAGKLVVSDAVMEIEGGSVFGLLVLNTGIAEIDGEGEINISDSFTGVRAMRGSARVSSVSATGTGSRGVHADNGSFVTADSVTVTGTDAYGIVANVGSEVNAGSVAVSGQGSFGVEAQDGSKVSVGSIIASGAVSIGISAQNTDTVVDVSGNVRSEGSAVVAFDEAKVTVGGFAESTNLVSSSGAVYCNDAFVEVKGNVTAKGSPDFTGVLCDGGEVRIGGSVISDDFGVVAFGGGGEVTVDGAITVPSGGTYIEIFGIEKSKSQNTKPTTKAGYFTYTENNDNIIGTVWVKAPASSGSSSSSTSEVPKTGDSTNMVSWGVALALSVMGIVSLPIAKKKMSK